MQAYKDVSPKTFEDEILRRAVLEGMKGGRRDV